VFKLYPLLSCHNLVVENYGGSLAEICCTFVVLFGHKNKACTAVLDIVGIRPVNIAKYCHPFGSSSLAREKEV
jgi:hypothetical protein